MMMSVDMRSEYQLFKSHLGIKLLQNRMLGAMGGDFFLLNASDSLKCVISNECHKNNDFPISIYEAK